MKKWKCLIVLLLFLVVFAAPAYGQEIEVPLSHVGTEEEMDKYEMPDGKSFLTNLKPGEQAAIIGAFSFEEGLEYELYKDGNRVSYVNEMLIQDAGMYRMKIVSRYGEDTVYSLFQFTIVPFNAGYLDQFQFGNVVEQPELEIEFDKEKREFIFTFPNSQSFRATIPQGGITRGEVGFEIPETMAAMIKYEDQILVSDVKSFWQPGNYQMTLTSSPDIQGRTTDYNTYILHFYFRIIPEIVNDTEIMNAPAGFYIRSVSLNGAGMKLFSGEYYQMKKDGRYQFIFTSEETNVEYTLELEKDTVAPILNIRQSYDRYGNVKWAAYETKEPGSTITVKQNGSLYHSASPELKEGGVYDLSIEDEAGNIRRYKIIIPFAREFTMKNKIIVILVMFLAVTGFMIYARKSMRVL